MRQVTLLEFRYLEQLADPGTDQRLLPTHLARGDNARRLRHCRTALQQGLHCCVSPVQRDMLLLHYGRGLRQREIARQTQRSPAMVSKTIKAGKTALQEYITRYMEIYDRIEQEFLREEIG